MKRIKDLLKDSQVSQMIGRKQELEVLNRLLDSNGPRVAYIHGLQGIGKSTLLQAFTTNAVTDDTVFLTIDGRSFEPTEDGILGALSRELNNTGPGLTGISEAIEKLASIVVVCIDHYENLRLIDDWLRAELLPAMGLGLRVLIASREPPGVGWRLAGSWRELVLNIELGPLGQSEAAELIAGYGHDETRARAINRFARGHPLSLCLAGWSGMNENEHSTDNLIERMAEDLDAIVMREIMDGEVRIALEATSVVRRITRDILSALVPGSDSEHLLARLKSLPFAAPGQEGLVIHEVVREAISHRLAATDPERHRHYCQAVWKMLQVALGPANRPDHWGYTADAIYLLQNPVVREAFFPSAPSEFHVMPARSEHFQAISKLINRYEPPGAVTQLDSWLKHQPEAFHVVLSESGEVAGFYCGIQDRQLNPSLTAEDPFAAAWLSFINSQPDCTPRGAYLIRRWLSADYGEAPCPAQAASWLDIKRSYMEMRPELRWVIMPLQDLGPYAEAAQTLGFKVLPDCEQMVDSISFDTVALDMGPGSVDRWISELLAAELGIFDDSILDVRNQELVLGDRRISLTPLEFDVFYCLSSNSGQAVARNVLLDTVWGRGYQGGSNVVDVVVRGLRKKLESDAGLVETIRGVGYRYSASQ